MNFHDDADLDRELAAWLRRQEPPTSSDRVARHVISQLSPARQVSRASWFLSAAATAAVVAIVGVVSGTLLAHVRPQPGPAISVGMDTSRLPAGTITITTPGYAGCMIGNGDSIWLQTGPAVRSWTRIDPVSNQVVASIGPGWDGSFGPDGSLWILLQGQQSTKGAPLAQVDPRTGATLRTINAVSGFHLAIDGTTGWVTGETKVYRVDLVSGHVMASIDAQVGKASAIAVLDGIVFVGGEGGLARVSPAVDAVTGVLDSASGQPFNVSHLAVGSGSVWAQMDGSGSVIRVNPVNLAVDAETDVGGTNLLYGPITYADGAVWTAAPGGIAKIDPGTNTIVQTIPMPWGEYGGMVVRDGEMWITVKDEMRVLRFPVR